MGKRFAGWTQKSIDLLYAPLLKNVEKQSKNRAPKKESVDYVGIISGALSVLKVEHVTEYKFLYDRRFRFDLAIPNKKIAVEFEGGIFTNGRHTRGKGYANDAKKYNLATMHGWKLLRYTSEDAKEQNWEYRVANEIKNMVELWNKKEN